MRGGRGGGGAEGWAAWLHLMAFTLSSTAVAHQQRSVSNNSSNYNPQLSKITIQHLLTAHTTSYTLLQICGSAGLSGPLPKSVSGVSALEAASQDSQLAGRRHLPAVRSQDSERRRLPVNTQTDLPRGGFGGLLGWLPQCAKDQGETLGNPGWYAQCMLSKHAYISTRAHLFDQA